MITLNSFWAKFNKENILDFIVPLFRSHINSAEVVAALSNLREIEKRGKSNLSNYLPVSGMVMPYNGFDNALTVSWLCFDFGFCW